MPRAGDLLLIEQVSIERGPDAHGAVTAHAHQPDSAGGQPLDRRDPDIFLEAAGDDFPFVEVDIHRAAHDPAFRLAAASASRALE